VITLFKPKTLVISVHIDHTNCTGNNQYNFNTETSIIRIQCRSTH